MGASQPIPQIPNTRIPYGNSSQVITSDANLTYDGTKVTAPSFAGSTDYTDNAMTAGSIGYSSTSKTHRDTDAIGDGAIRKALDVQIVDGTTITGTSETALYSSPYSISANSITARRMLEFDYWGIVSSAVAAPGTITIKIKLSSTVVITITSPTLPTSLSNATWRLVGRLICRTVGASGTFEGIGQFDIGNETLGVASVFDQGTAHDVVVDTTSTMNLSTTVTFSATGNSITARSRIIEG